MFGGEDGPEKFNPEIRYRGSLQNYLIDTGKDVILVDTGLPAGTSCHVTSLTMASFRVVFNYTLFVFSSLINDGPQFFF